MRIRHFKNKLLENTYLVLAIIVLFGLLLRLIFFSGMGISDSLVYSKAANDLNIGKGIDPDSTLTLSTRIGLVYTTALSYRLFGINDLSSVLFVLLTSIGGIILIFYFGRLLFNEKIGLMASFLLSFFPLDVVYSTKLGSDLPSAFFMSLGIYVFLYSELRRKTLFSYLISGILIGIAYMMRESALLIVLFFIAYVAYKKRLKKEYFLVPAGVAIVIFVEIMFFWSLTGNPLYRIEASQDYLENAAIAVNFYGRLDFPTGLFHYPWLFLTNSLLLYFYIFIFIALAYIATFGKKEAMPLVLWLIPLILYLSFGSASFTQYIPFGAVDRYTSIITFPGILMLSFFLTEKSKAMKKAIMPSILMLLLVSSIASVYLHGKRNSLDGLKEIYPELLKLKKLIYTDERTIKSLDYISGYNQRLDLREFPDSLENIRAYILVERNIMANVKAANKDITFPMEIGYPPVQWKVVKEIGKDENRITLYYSS